MKKLLSGAMVAGNTYNVLINEGIATQYINGNRDVVNGIWEEMTYVKTDFADRVVSVMFKNKNNVIICTEPKNHMVSLVTGN